jgi:ABC-type glutathione transport system ATPase component
MGVTIGMPPWKSPAAEQKRAIDDAMALVGADKVADKPIGQMSGGQLQRVMIARALAAKPRLLLLDEPTVGIDPAGQQQFGEFLGSLVKQLGLTLIVVSHDIRTIAGCDRIASSPHAPRHAPEGLTPKVRRFRHESPRSSATSTSTPTPHLLKHFARYKHEDRCTT